MNREFLKNSWIIGTLVLLFTTIVWGAIMTFPWFTLAWIGFGLVSLVVCLAKHSTVEVSSDDPMISMVAFFETLPFVDEMILAERINRAWNVELQFDQTSESFVTGAAPLFVIKKPHQMYVVNYCDSNYFANIEEVASEVPDLRLSNVIRRHRGWISVDLVLDSQGLAPEHHYAMIGKLLNELTNQDCVALLLPDRMKLVPWDNSVEDLLASGGSIGELRPSQPPVISIDDDHPELLEAVAISRKRFPQFVAAFESHQRDEDRDPSDQFAVKAPIVICGRNELMWINATAIENGILYGTLDNWPVGSSILRRGDRVRVAVSSINDWTYTRGDRIFGGFTSKVISRWARDQKSYS